MILSGLKKINEDLDPMLIDNYKKEFEKSIDQMEDVEDQSDDRGSEKYVYNHGQACLHGKLDYADNVLIVKKLHHLDDFKIGKKLLKCVIDNLELNHPEIDAIIWEIDKKEFKYVLLTTKCGFSIAQAKPLTFVVSYDLASVHASTLIFDGSGRDDN